MLWMAVGLLLVLLLALEALYRSQAAARRGLRDWRAGEEPSPDPAITRQLAGYEADLPRTLRPEWRPFVYYRLPFHRGALVNVDSLGRRRTVQANDPGAPSRAVFVFGASPVWGTGLADSATIPSRLAVALRDCGIPDAEVTNFGEAGYVFAQEVIELILQLRAGQRPAAVVFYDSYNDVAAGIAGWPGATKAESTRARDFALGRRLFPPTSGALTDLSVGRALAGLAVQRVQLLRRFGPEPRVDSPLPNDSIASLVAASYLATAEVVQALAAHYGFTPVYAWMPILDPSMKPLSALERRVDRAIRGDPYDSRLLDIHRRVRARLSVSAPAAIPGRYADLAALFAGDTSTVFVDELGHNSEPAVRVIAGELARAVSPALNGVPTRCVQGR